MSKKVVPANPNDLYFRLGLGLAAALCLSGCLSGSMIWQQLPVMSTPSLQLKWTSVLNTPLSVNAGAVIAPNPEISVVDFNGNRVTAGAFPVSLEAYSDSQCTTIYKFRDHQEDDSTSGPPQVITSQGVAQFSNLKVYDAVSFYVQASSPGLLSACSQKVTVLAGPPHHLGNASTTPLSMPLRSSAGIAFQLMDAYHNPVSIMPPVQVTMSLAGPSGVSLNSISAQSSDAVGKISNLIFSAGQSGVAVVKAVLASAPSVAGFDMTPAVISVNILPGAPSITTIKPVGADYLDRVTYWGKVVQFDSDGNLAFTPSALSLLFWDGLHFNPLGFNPWDYGQKWLPFSSNLSVSTTLPGIFSNLSTVLQSITDVSAPVTCSAPFTPSTGSEPFVDSNSLNLIGLDWQLSTDAMASCAQVNSGGLTFTTTGSPKLKIQGSQFQVGVGGRVQGELNQASIIEFYSSTSQVFRVDPLAGPVNLPTVNVTTATSASAHRSLAFEGGPATVFGDLTFGGMVCSTGPCQTLFINSLVELRRNLVIPNQIRVVISPRGILRATQGITLQGQLLIQGGGVLLVGAGQAININPGAASTNAQLILDGSLENNMPAIIDVVPVSGIDPNYSLFFSTSGPGVSQFDGSGFIIANLSSIPGMHFAIGSQILRMEKGVFRQFPSTGTLIQFQAGMVPNSPMNRISQVGFESDPKTSSIQIMNGAVLDQDMYVLNSYFGYQPSESGLDALKTNLIQSSSSNHLLIGN